MMTCRLCHFTAELDDLVLVNIDGQAICLRCYGRVTGSHRPMPAALRRAVIAALAELHAAQPPDTGVV